jgi:hypothetical protein
MRKTDMSLGAYFLMVFLAAGLTLAIVPGCGDDDSSPDSEYEPPQYSDSMVHIPNP